MSHYPLTGKTLFTGNQDLASVTLEAVATFKYLGVSLSSSPYGFFRAHNENAKARARQYLQSVLSLVKTGPDWAELDYTLWGGAGDLRTVSQ